jgi:oxygen-independent coproporphyrinogen-3 oxidase
MPASADKAPGSEAESGLAVYVHWPFCASKCPYCDFNSHVRDAVDQERWGRALGRELEYYAERTTSRTVTSIFFGGGTPSLMDPGTVASVVDRVSRLWNLTTGAEITLEANPTSVEVSRFEALRAAGVNRLSLGVQALNDADLKALGRWHSVEDARRAFKAAQSDFPRVSFDLIYCRPGQTAGAWRQELSEALDLATGHLSLYQLTVEPGTAFYREQRAGRLTLPAADEGARMLEQTWDLCARQGYGAYEVSNFATPGQECRHNLAYWRYGEYVGAGPGAHGRITMDGAIHATAQRRSPEGWLKDVEAMGHGTEVLEALSADACATECLIMGLRTREGVSAVRFEQVAGMPLVQGLDGRALAEFVGRGLLEWDHEYLRATMSGLMVLDTLLARLIR